MVVRTFRMPADQLTPAGLLSALKPQLAGAGFRSLFQCETRQCGGFDFRMAVDLVRPPNMEFALDDFAWLATAGTRGQIGLIASRTPRGLFLQVTEVAPPEARPDLVAATTASTSDPAAGDLAQQLATRGRAVLEGLTFEPGAQTAPDGAEEALRPVADYLADNPAASAILVGHTDNRGSLDSNVAISRARAAVVRQVLIDLYDIDPRRLTAEGAGFLAPRASNATDEGRARNRRVEIVLR